jgi:hypothetical protein
MYTIRRRGWVSSQQLISPPGQRKLHLLPDLINLVVDLSRCKESAAEIAQFMLADLAFNRLSIIGLSASRKKPPPETRSKKIPFSLIRAIFPVNHFIPNYRR